MTSVAGNRDPPAAATASSARGGGERCPRCGSHSTKFCYYNNYNLAQPRHFCKDCRRYWTLGGSLRDVPIGGSTRSTVHRSKQQTAGRPGTAPAPPSSSSYRCRLLPAQASATTYASPSSSSSFSSPDSGAPSNVPVSVAPYTESATSYVSGVPTDDVGLFTPLLTEPSTVGFMALRDPYHHGFDAFPLEPGLASSPTRTADWLSFGMGEKAVPWPSFGEDRVAGPRVDGNGEAVGAELVGSDGGDWFVWPELAISATPGECSGLRRTIG